ncbi:DNA primase [Streptomyces sp. NPDC058246]|uniref:DNA primase n=1 Tax=Streptomyces sp. NPDC058246 TaxID=3346400 RepID=UPI0036F10550
MNRLGLGLAVGAGYVLGRTKKMKLAFAVGTMVAGKRMHLSPRALADLVAGQLRDNPQFKEIGDQLREDLRGVGKAASGALVERQIEGLADRLHGRTAEVRDQLAGVVPDVPGLGEEDEAEDEAGEQDDTYEEDGAYGEDGAEDADGADDDADDEGGSGDDSEHGDAEEKARPRKKAPARKAPAKKAAGKPGPARKTSARKASAGKAPTKTAAAEKAPGNKTAAKKTAARTAKKAPAKKTATAKSATRRTPRTRMSSGGGDDE